MSNIKYVLFIFIIFLLIIFAVIKFGKSSIKDTSGSVIVDNITEVSKDSDIHILFGGDMMFDRSIRSISNREGYDYILTNLTELLINKDLVVLNLEGPITNNNSISMNSKIGTPANYIFTFEPLVTSTLLKNNIKLVNLGNNHILNQGSSGLVETKEHLTKSGISYFGNINGNEYHVYSTDIKGLKFSFINYNEFMDNGLSITLDQIKNASASDFIVVYAHWGPEYVKTATSDQMTLAHGFIDAGADLVIGTHPHVIQNIEVYKDKYIYYSLGNFVFDQYFSPDTKRGLLIDMLINTGNPNLSAYREYYVDIKTNGQSILDNN